MTSTAFLVALLFIPLLPLVLTLDRSASLSGIVVDPEGRPVAGATVEPSPPAKRSLNPLRDTPPIRSQEDGRFVLTGLVPQGTYEIHVSSEGFARTTVTARTAAPGQASPEVRIVLDPGRTLSGRVVDEEGRAVAVAELMLLDELREKRRVSSDETGRFKIERLAPGTFSLLIKGKGHPQIHLPDVEIPAGRPAIDLGDLVLPIGFVIEGRVTDSLGRPLEGAVVSSRRSQRMYDPRELRRRRVETFPSTKTGPDGTFRLGELKNGESFDLYVQHPGHVAAHLPDVKAPSTEPLRIELRKARSLSGRVVGPGGEPIAGADLSQVQGTRTISGMSGSSGELRRPLGNTDAEGAFRVGGIEPGSLDLRVTAAGYRPKVLEGLLVPEDQDLENLQIVLDRSVSVEVRVLSTEGEPMAGEWVSVEPESPEDPLEAMRLDMDYPSDETDERGITRIEVPKPGRYYFSLGNREVFKVVEVAPDGTSVELLVPTALQVSGRVVDENGEGVPAARVTLKHSRGGGSSSGSLWTDADGSFSFPGAETGTLRLIATKKGFADSPPQEIVATGQPVRGIELRLTRHPLSGNAAITGRLLGLAPEDLLRTQVGASTESRFESEPGKVSPDGGYRIEGLKPGLWQVAAVTASGHRAMGTVRLAPGVPEAVLDLEFGGLTLSGRVLVEGVPLAGAQVEAWAGSWKVAGQSRTDYAGAFTLSGLPKGVYRLVVRTRETGSDVSDSRTVVDLEENRAVEVRIPTGRLSGRIVSGAAGAPVAGATVLLDSLHQEIDSTFSAPSARSGGDGTFQSSRLSAGTYKVTVRKEGFAPAEATVEVRPGEEATVEVVLQPQDAP